MLIRLDRHCCDDGRVRQNRRSRWSFHGPWLNPTILTTKRKLLLLLLHGSWWNRCWRMNGRGGGSVRWFSTFRNVKVACVCLASSVVDAGKFFYIYVLAWAADSFNCQFGWHQCVVFKKDLFSGISVAVITPLNFNPFRCFESVLLPPSPDPFPPSPPPPLCWNGSNSISYSASIQLSFRLHFESK